MAKIKFKYFLVETHKENMGIEAPFPQALPQLSPAVPKRDAATKLLGQTPH